MQRRAAALYFALFLVIGAGSYAYVTMDSGVNAQKPTVSLDAQTYSQGDEIRAGGQTYVVDEITTENASEGGEVTHSGTLTWTNQSEENTEDLAEGANVTLADGQTRVVHFPDGETVQLSTDIQAYQDGVAKQEYFHERKAGLWGVSIISFIAAIILLGTAYLPVKD